MSSLAMKSGHLTVVFCSMRFRIAGKMESFLLGVVDMVLKSLQVTHTVIKKYSQKAFFESIEGTEYKAYFAMTDVDVLTWLVETA